ncbi:MAG: DsbA family protein [Solirubrobacteraceae bacterium]|nr:MAG: hypothetical protein DLM63_02805 [Solirubrobacterales bacterium]
MSGLEPETKRERRARAREERRERETAEAAAALRRTRLAQLGVLAVAAAAVVALLVVLLVNDNSTKSKIKTVAGEAVPGEGYVNALFAGIPEQGLALGNPQAPVTMDEFADLQCPFCRQYSVQALADLVNQYVRPGKVRMVFHSLDFIGNDSHTAALAAQAAGQQNRLWPFIELWYENQGTENSGYVTDAFINKIAQGAGVNVAALTSARRSPPAQTAIDDANALATANNVNSTPSFLLGRSGGKPTPFQPSSLTTGAFTGALNQVISRSGG